MEKTEYISRPNVNNGQPLPVYEMGKIYPGHPLFEMAQSTPTFLEVVKAEAKENSPISTSRQSK